MPRAYIAWAVEGRTSELLRGHRALNELITLPRGWLRSPRKVLALRRKLRAQRFDTSIDMQGLTKSAVAAWLSGAVRRVGFDGADGRELSRWLNNVLVPATSAHVIDRNLELLGALGFCPTSARFDLEDTATDAATAQGIVQLQALGDRFAVINPGAGWKSKLWPTERYAEVASHLGNSWALRSLVVWAGEAERAMAARIVAGANGWAQLAPATSLCELAAIARRAALFIGSDTGPMHLAAAVGTPCVGLYGPMPATRNGPYGPQHVALQKVLLEGNSRQRRGAGPESMQAISTSDVCAACELILARDSVAKRSA